MSKRNRRNHAPAFKAKVALAAAFVVTPAGQAVDPPVDVKTLHAKIGELALENDFLEQVLGKAGLRGDLSARQ